MTNKEIDNMFDNSFHANSLYFDVAKYTLEEWIEYEIEGFTEHLIICYIPDDKSDCVYIMDNFRYEPNVKHSMAAIGCCWLDSPWYCTWRKVTNLEALSIGIKELKIKLKKFQIEQDFKH